MEEYASHLAKLFEKLPGIGSRQAKRFAYFILTQPNDYVNNFADTLKNARNHARTCKTCLRTFEGLNPLCNICNDKSRNPDTIIVVEKSQDIDAFKNTDFNGIFFVLGGLIPIVQKNILASTNIQILIDKTKNQKSLKEIILAFPITPNGEYTDQVIREVLLSPIPTFEISSLGRGLSTGTELEYADTASLLASLKKRE